MSPSAAWYNEPSRHIGECNCGTCHEAHVENDEVETNAKMVDFKCCKDQREVWADEQAEWEQADVEEEFWPHAA